MTQLASSQPVPTELVVVKGYVYWVNTEGKSVMRVALKGGTPEEFVKGQTYCNTLTYDAKYLYWSSLTGKLWKAAFDNPVPEVVVNRKQLPDGLAVDDTHLYWVDSAQRGFVYRMLKSGGKVEEIGRGAFPHKLKVDSEYVFWTEISSGKVMRLHKQTLQAVALATKEPDPNGLAIDSTHVYWTNLDAGNIRRAPKSGKGPVVTLADKQASPHHLVVDEKYVYWANNADGTIMAILKTGGKPFVVSKGYKIPYQLTWDASFLYWTTGLRDGALFKIAR